MTAANQRGRQTVSIQNFKRQRFMIGLSRKIDKENVLSISRFSTRKKIVFTVKLH